MSRSGSQPGPCRMVVEKRQGRKVFGLRSFAGSNAAGPPPAQRPSQETPTSTPTITPTITHRILEIPHKMGRVLGCLLFSIKLLLFLF